MNRLNPFILCLPSPIAGEYSRLKLRNKQGKDPQGQGFRRGNLSKAKVSAIYHDGLSGMSVNQMAELHQVNYHVAYKIAHKKSYSWFTDRIDYELAQLEQEIQGWNNAIEA